MNGSLQAGGKKRPVPDATRIAVRVAGFKFQRHVAEGVVPLNPGFFRLEQMRGASMAKRKDKGRAKVRQS